MNTEQQILSACREEIRNFSDQEKSYIIKNQKLINRLIDWYKNNLSDGCWTAGNLLFIRHLVES